MPPSDGRDLFYGEMHHRDPWGNIQLNINALVYCFTKFCNLQYLDLGGGSMSGIEEAAHVVRTVAKLTSLRFLDFGQHGFKNIRIYEADLRVRDL